MAVCGTVFSRGDFTDQTGCLLPEGHEGPHLCKSKYNGFVEWEYDFDCNCPDCLTDDINDMCIVYSINVKKP